MVRFYRTTPKKKKIVMDQKCIQLLSAIASSVSGEQGEDISPSDVMAGILLEPIHPRYQYEERLQSELPLTLPEGAWDILSALSKEHGVGEAAILEKLIQVEASKKRIRLEVPKDRREVTADSTNAESQEDDGIDLSRDERTSELKRATAH